MRLVLVCGCVGGGQRLSADRLRAHTPACPPAHLQPSCRWAGPSSVQPPMGSPPVYPLYSAAAPAAPPSPLRVHLVAGCGGWELFALSSSSPSSPAPAVSLTAVNQQQIRHRMLKLPWSPFILRPGSLGTPLPCPAVIVFSVDWPASSPARVPPCSFPPAHNKRAD